MQASAAGGDADSEASTPSHMSSPWGTDASESDEEDSVFSAAAAARHALAAGNASRALSDSNQAKMRETGATGMQSAGFSMAWLCAVGKGLAAFRLGGNAGQQLANRAGCTCMLA